MFFYVLHRAVVGGGSYVVTLPITRTFYCILSTGSVDITTSLELGGVKS